MASDPQTPADKTSPPPDREERSATPSRSSDTSRQQGSPRQTAQNLAPRNGIPPKRLSMMVNRKPATTSSTASRSSISSTSHANPGTGLSKPPTRPLPSSSTRRPAPGVALAPAATYGHKKRASVSSFDIKNKGDESASEELVKPSKDLSENRPFKPDVKKPTPNLSSTSQRNPLNLSSNMESRLASSRQNIGSPTKTSSRPTTTGSRPSMAHGTLHNARPLASSARAALGGSGPDARKKRLSTIPASPAPQKPESDSSAPLLSLPAAIIPARPNLGTRKSTMSVSLEQSLREMELVHQMLHVAMAEDGHEDDETKEEYSKKVDESLASLRAKLEEARRSQGLEVGDSRKDAPAQVPKPMTVDGETGTSPDEVSKLKAGLTESHSKVKTLNAELAALESKVLHRDLLPEDALLNVAETFKKLGEYFTSIVAQRIENNSEYAHDYPPDTYQEDMEKLRSEQKSKIDDLAANHTQELGAVHSRLDEAEAKHKEHIRQAVAIEEAQHSADAEKAKKRFDSQLSKYTSALQGLERQIDEEKTNGLNARSMIQDLQSEVSSLQELLSEAGQRHTETTRKSDEQHLNTIKEKEDSLKMKDQDISKLRSEIQELQQLLSEADQRHTEAIRHSDEQHLNMTKEKEDSLIAKDLDISKLRSEIQELQVIQSRQLEEASSAALEQSSTLEAELAALRETIGEVEASYQDAIIQHNETLKSKQEEIRSLGTVIEDFESQMQELHTMIEKGIDGAKLEFLEEHKQAVADLESKHSEEIEAAALRHEEEREILRNDHLDSIRRLDDEMAELQQSLENSERASEAAKVTDAETIDALNVKLRAFESERDEAQAAKIAMSDALQQATNETLSLKKCLDTVGEDNRNREAEHVRNIKQMKDELEAAVDLLEERRIEGISASEKHAAELQELRMNHAKNIAGQTIKSQGMLQDLQKKHEDLFSVYEQAEKDGPLRLQSLQIEHKEALEKLMRDLENIRMTHLQEKDELKSDAERLRSEDRLGIESSHVEKAAKAGEKYQMEIDGLKEQHEIECISLRDELEDAKKEKNLAQQAHDAALSDVRSQLQHHIELLANAKKQIRVTKEAHDDRISPEKLAEILQEFEQVRLQLTNSQAEADQAKSEAARLETAAREVDVTATDRLRKEISELSTQHAAEITKIQGTMSLENEKREKERKQGAEVRDRLAAESERIRLDLLAANERAKENERTLDISNTKTEDVSQQLSAASQAAENHKNDSHKAKEELKAAQAEIERLKMANLQVEKKACSDLARELEVLRKAVDAEREISASLEKRLREGLTVSEKYAMRVREVESALKVTTAELVESHTERLNGITFSASPNPMSGLPSDGSTAREQIDEGQDDGVREGGELGPEIEANLAGMQEQIRQIDTLAEDMIEESKRFLGRFSIVRNLDHTPTNGRIEIAEEE